MATDRPVGLRPLFTLPAAQYGGAAKFAWNSDGSYLFTVGSNGRAFVHDRQGTLVCDVALEIAGACVAVDWDKDGEMVAVAVAGSSRVALWELSSRAVAYIDTGLAGITFAAWSPSAPVLGIGAQSGFVLFGKATRKLLPCKASAPAVSGEWSRDGKQLALGGADNVLTVASVVGEIVDEVEIKASPVSVKFGGAGNDAPSPMDSVVSVNMGGASLLLYDVTDPDSPKDLGFQPRHGAIVAHCHATDSYMAVGFADGTLTLVSTKASDVGREVFATKVAGAAAAVAWSPAARKLAVGAGAAGVKLLSLNNGWAEDAAATPVSTGAGDVACLSWTHDGQVLTAATVSGAVVAFSAASNTLLATHASSGRAAVLTAPTEVTVLEAAHATSATVAAGTAFTAAPTGLVARVKLGLEPDQLAVGPDHLAAVVGATVHYHRATGAHEHWSKARDYPAPVDAVVLGGASAAVRVGGRVFVHPVEATGAAELVLPAPGAAPITTLAVGGDFLFLGDADGAVSVFSLPDSTVLPDATFKLPPAAEGGAGVAVAAVFPNPLGTRAVVIDTEGRGFLMNPLDGTGLPFPGPLPGAAGGSSGAATPGVAWDAADRNVFVLYTSSVAVTHLYAPTSLSGPSVTQIGYLTVEPNGDITVEPMGTPLPGGFTPLGLFEGTLVTYSHAAGRVTRLKLCTHDQLPASGAATSADAGVLLDPAAGTPDEVLRACFCQCIGLLRLRDAWRVACLLGDRAYWLGLSGKALEALDVELAQRVYRRLGDAGMVCALEALLRLEDRRAVAGHVAALFGEYQLAQQLLLQSSQPRAALDLRKDLLQWETALRLAETLDPSQVPAICVEFGKQCEFQGDNAKAATVYKSALQRLAAAGSGGAATAAEAAEAEAVRRAAVAGSARTAIRLGDIADGVRAASSTGDAAVMRECAAILEAAKALPEAASLYLQAGLPDKGVAILLATKAFAAAAPHMASVTSVRLHAAYAKAKEVAKEYAEAAVAYERSRDYDAVVRLLLDHLNEPERAASLVRSTRSEAGACHVARYCAALGDYRGAIEFLLLARKRDDAFELACKHQEMDLYVRALRIALAAHVAGTDPNALMAAAAAGGASALGALSEVQLPEAECLRIAGWYEAHGQTSAAAALYSECARFSQALDLYLAAAAAATDGSGSDAVADAIAVVGRARDEALTQRLVAFLKDSAASGAASGVDVGRCLFRLHVALNAFPEAARAAVAAARAEQDAGSYKAAHGRLLDAYRELRARGVRVPSELVADLTLLHSYLLVKKLVRLEDHAAAARMMVRVARAASRFPAHVVPILTSAVIECQRAGMRRSAFEWGAVLMRPEHRDRVEEKFRKKLEALVRRPSNEEADEPATACPFCDALVPAYQLDCSSCRATIPFCIATGAHMTIDDCTACPNCSFPALYTPLVAHLSVDPSCPMCAQSLLPGAVQPVKDPLALLRKAQGGAPDEEGLGGGGGGEAAEGKDGEEGQGAA